MRLTVRIRWSASPERRFPRLAPPFRRSPSPARRRSISAQSAGAEHAITMPRSFSTQRKAGMSSFEPSRIPAWLAPVCEERSVSHSTKRCDPSASQRAIVGAFPSRMARWSTGFARPSISRYTIPGTSVSMRSPERRAMRWMTRIMYASSSFVPATTSSTVAIAEMTSAARIPQPAPPISIASSVTASAIRNTATLSASSRRNEVATVYGRRIAATIGDRTAFSAAIRSAASNASQKSPRRIRGGGRRRETRSRR